MILKLSAFQCATLMTLILTSLHVRADDTAYFIPQLLSAQYTFIDQHQDPLRSPYAGPLSLDADGDTERSHTFGAYLGIPLTARLQFYFDMEMFKGEGVSGATGLGGGVNGDVVHAGTANLGKRPYVARRYFRYVLPLGDSTHAVERAQDQLPGNEADRHMEFKLGKFAVNDDFDKNRYANSARTQFLNTSLVNDTAWDFAADTRGYTNGAMVAYVAPGWALRYGIFQMPTTANGQTLEWPLDDARGEQTELTLQPAADGWALRILAFRNIANMGAYHDAIAIAEATGTVPDIRADDHPGRHKYGLGTNFELPLADDGDTGIFARLGWNDGQNESFAFTEVDGTASVGAQLSGTHWSRSQDHFGIAVAVDALSTGHRDYLAAGGSGFLLGDGALNYGREQIIETYYRWHLIDHIDLSPDFQFVRDPGFNRDRGPARFLGLRAHVEI
jgi:high affinity Mn2+ porin